MSTKLLSLWLFILLLCSSINSKAATVTSVATGNWSNPLIWFTAGTGTITATTGSATINGVGTAFNTQLAVGMTITNTSNTVIGVIQSISSATVLTLTANASVAVAAGSSFRFRKAPTSVDAVVIASTHTVTFDITSATITTLTMNATSSTTSGLNISGTNALTITGNVTMTQPATGGTRTLLMSIGSGAVNIGGSLTMTGSSASRITSITVGTGTLDINGAVTPSSAAGCLLTINSTGTINFGSSVGSTITLTTGSSGTMNYDGGAQTIVVTTYQNLGLLGSGTKTTTTAVGVNGTLTIGGTAVQSTTLVMGASSGITFNGVVRNTTTTEWPATFSGTGGINLINGSGVTLNAAKVLSNGVNLTISGSSSLTTGGFGLTLGGSLDLTNVVNDAIYPGASPITINGSGTQNIEYLTTTGNISVNKSAGIINFINNVSCATLTLTLSGTAEFHFGNAGTFNYTDINFVSGNIYGGIISFINITGNGINAANFTPELSQIYYSGAAQNVANMNYYFVEFSGSGVKTLPTGFTTAEFLNVSGTASVSANAHITIGSNLSIASGSSFSTNAKNISVTNSTNIDGTLTISGGSISFSTGALIINSGGVFSNTSNATVTVNAELSNAGTFTSGTNNIILAGSSTISGTLTIVKVNVSGTYTNNGNLTITSALDGSGTLTNGSTASITFTSATVPGITTLDCSTSGNTVTYNFAGTQALRTINYHHLNIGGSGSKNFPVSGSFNINGNYTTSGTATVSHNGTLTINGNTLLQNTSTINLNGYSVEFNGNVTINSGANIIFDISPVTLGGNNKTFLNSNGSSTISSLIIQGGAVTFNSDMNITGILSITSGSTFVFGSTSSLTLGGLVDGTGVIRAKACGLAANTLTVGGTSTGYSIFLESGFHHLSNLIITKALGTVLFESDVAVSTSLQLPTTGSCQVSFLKDLNLYGTVSITSGATSRINTDTNSSLTIGGCSTTGTTLTIPNGIFNNSPIYSSLTLNRTNGLVLGNQTVSVYGVLNILAGNLNTNNILVLKSTASATARVAPITNGGASISGNVTVERFIPGGNNKRKWRFLSSPVNITGSIPLSQLQDDIFITAPSGSAGGFDVSPFASNSSIRTYNESVAGSSSNGWADPSNISNTIVTGQGMEVFVRGSRNLANPYLPTTVPDNVTIDYAGTLNTGTIVRSLSYTNTGSGTNDGFNLVGNPYASPINFDTTGWTKTNIENKYWSYNPNTTLYGSYNVANGESINGMTKYISSGQGFFVRATSASPSITFTEGIKSINAGNNYFRTGGNTQGKFPVLKVMISNDSLDVDESLIILDPNSTYKGDDNTDMFKFFNDALNIYSIGKDNSRLSMNAIPYLNGTDTINLPIWSFDGSVVATIPHKLLFSRFESIEPSINIYLLDKFTNSIIDIRQQAEYNFIITTDLNSYGNDRFKIILTNNKLTNISNKSKNKFVIYPNPAEDVLFINEIENQDEFEIRILDMLGREVRKEYFENKDLLNRIDVSNLIEGQYILRIIRDNDIHNHKFIKK